MAPIRADVDLPEAADRCETSLNGSDCFLSPAESSEFSSGEDALARIRRLIADGGMTAVVQREQSTTMASMGGFGNNIIVSHRIHRGSQTGSAASRLPADPASPPPSTSGGHLLNQPPVHTVPPPTAASPTQQLTPMWGPPGPSDPQSDTISLDDLVDGGRTDDSPLPAPSSSLLLSSPPSSSSSPSSHSPLTGNGAPPSNGYPSDPYGR